MAHYGMTTKTTKLTILCDKGGNEIEYSYDGALNGPFNAGDYISVREEIGYKPTPDTIILLEALDTVWDRGGKGRVFQIKAIRHVTGLGLKESLEISDWWEKDR